jgi:hypothetical protein
MVQRCTNKMHPKYKHYGARGIVVHPPWRLSFKAFEADAGPHPGPGWSLDRIDNDLGYLPGNIRWATSTVQNRNRGYTKLTLSEISAIRAADPGKTQRELAAQFGVSRSHIHRILHSEAWA